MREKTIIDNILGKFKRSEDQLNEAFECDAEIVKTAGSVIAVTMDEFSNEDMFGRSDLSVLGSNMAIAVLSDLFACGATPKFFIHAIVLADGEKDSFAEELSTGISNVLEKAGCSLIGGDLGCGEKWRYTATAIGELDGEKYISRKLPLIEQDLWVTGTLGDANLAALSEENILVFELRENEADYIRENALACIDTSGGFIDSLWTLSEVNPCVVFDIQTDKLPFDHNVLAFCKEHGVPSQAFLFGGAGEYELIFTLPAGIVPDIVATKIGSVRISDEPGIFFNTSGNVAKLECAPPCAREVVDKVEYINLILEQVSRVFK